PFLFSRVTASILSINVRVGTLVPRRATIARGDIRAIAGTAGVVSPERLRAIREQTTEQMFLSVPTTEPRTEARKQARRASARFAVERLRRLRDQNRPEKIQ